MRKNMYLAACGRGSDYTEFMKRAVSECGKENPSVAYIGTANGERTEFFRSYTVPMLKMAGAGDVNIVRLLGHDKGSARARSLLAKSDMIYISGGEVEDGIRGIPEDIKVLLRQLYEAGTVFTSVSAGTIMLGLAWPHWDDEDNEPEKAILFECLGFAPTVFDTHCEGEDWIELRKAVELSPEGFTGYGIPTGGAVVISPDGSLCPTIPLDAYRKQKGKAVCIGKYSGKPL